jgi:hypothetical protein
MKTDKYILELIVSPLIAFSGGIINLNWPNLLTCKDPTVVISKSIDISFIIFGFLLTVLALILQTNKEIRSRKLYPRLIRFNKRIVLISIISGVYTLCYNSLFDSISKLGSKEYFVSIFIVLMVWIFLDLINFIKVFYKLAEEGKI